MTKVKPFSEAEWWVGIGIMIYAAPAGGGGVEKLFNKPRGAKHRHKKLPSLITRQKVGEMSRKRFDDFKKFLPHSFEGNDPKDPWNQIMGLVNDFNKNRKQNIAASVKKFQMRA